MCPAADQCRACAGWGSSFPKGRSHSCPRFLQEKPLAGARRHREKHGMAGAGWSGRGRCSPCAGRVRLIALREQMETLIVTVTDNPWLAARGVQRGLPQHRPCSARGPAGLAGYGWGLFFIATLVELKQSLYKCCVYSKQAGRVLSTATPGAALHGSRRTRCGGFQTQPRPRHCSLQEDKGEGLSARGRAHTRKDTHTSRHRTFPLRMALPAFPHQHMGTDSGLSPVPCHQGVLQGLSVPLGAIWVFPFCHCKNCRGNSSHDFSSPTDK